MSPVLERCPPENPPKHGIPQLSQRHPLTPPRCAMPGWGSACVPASTASRLRPVLRGPPPGSAFRNTPPSPGPLLVFPGSLTGAPWSGPFSLLLLELCARAGRDVPCSLCPSARPPLLCQVALQGSGTCLFLPEAFLPGSQSSSCVCLCSGSSSSLLEPPFYRRICPLFPEGRGCVRLFSLHPPSPACWVPGAGWRRWGKAGE